jgi:plastocyanin
MTIAYAVVAVLALVTPLSASEEPPPGGPEMAPAAPPADPAPTEPPPPELAPAEPAPSEPAPAEAAPPTDPGSAPVVEPAPPAPAQPAPTATAPAPAESAPAETASGKRSRDRAGRRPRARAAASSTVTIRDFEFAPASVAINAGDTVTWTNEGPTPHSATADGGSFDTGVFRAGQSRSQTFDQAGTFTYFCTPHPNMQGTITVRSASAGGDDDADTGSTAGDTATGSQADDGPALAATGLDAGGLAALGLTTLLLGAWLHRRARAAG